MGESIVIAKPVNAQQLILLFHGVGASAEHLVPLGQKFATEFPQACVVSVSAPIASDLGQGFQWFSVRGITEDNRAGRIAVAMPAFEAIVKDWQQKTGLDAPKTTLAGFSQGAIMSLESTAVRPALAHRIVSMAGRFAGAAIQPEAGTVIHLFHGQMDAVVAPQQTARAAEELKALGTAVTADYFALAKHEITSEMAARIVERLRA